MGPRPHLSFCACKTLWLTSESLVSMGLSPHLWFVHAKQRLLDQNYKTLWGQASPVDLWMQNSVLRIRITGLYGPHPSYVVFAWKTATFGWELHVSIGPWLRLLIFECKTASLDPEILLSIGPRLHLSFHACKTTWLASELLVSMGASSHLLLLRSKQPLLD